MDVISDPSWLVQTGLDLLRAAVWTLQSVGNVTRETIRHGPGHQIRPWSQYLHYADIEGNLLTLSEPWIFTLGRDVRVSFFFHSFV